jgi:hypothetical protein
VIREYPDVETVVVGLLIDSGIVTGAGTNDLPGNVAYRLPYALVQRAGGDDNGVSDFPTVDIEVYAAQRVNGRHLCERIRQYLTGGGRPPYPLDRVETVGAVTELPYGGRRIRRWSNTYRITTRRITVAS